MRGKTDVLQDRLFERHRRNGGSNSPGVTRVESLDSMHWLAERAEEQGYLTIDDLLELFPAAEDNLSQVETAMARFQKRGIEFIMPDDKLLSPSEHEVEEKHNGEDEEQAEDEDVDLSGVDSHDSVSLYFRQMGNVPLLTRAEELQLATQMERGRRAQEQLLSGHLLPPVRARCVQQVDTGNQAREHMVKANTRLVVSIAKRYLGLGVPLLDLIQEGNLGLMKAVRRFDHRRGCKVSTYATWWIRQSITRALSVQGRVIRLPSYIGYSIRKMYQIAQQIEQETGTRPTCEQIAARLGVSLTRVRWLMKVSQQPVSLQKPVGEDEDSVLEEFIEDEDSPAPADEVTDVLMAEAVERALATLTPREERILCLRFGLHGQHPHTLKEVAIKFGLTRERIRQIEREALCRLRHPSRSRALRPYSHESYA